MRRCLGVAGRLLVMCALSGAAGAQPYTTMAGQADPRDFVSRADGHLSLLDEKRRFGGADIGWLGLRQDGGAPARRPTAFEIRDVLATLQALGGEVVRSRTLAATAGCALCLEPAPGQFDPAAFGTIDLVLKTARDLGLKVIIPLAGRAPDCADTAPAAPEGQAAGEDSICPFVRWHGLTDRMAFFSDTRIRADFLARVATILDHVNTLTGVAYRDDPTILAWENCDSCGADADTALVAAWTEQLGQAIKSADPHHLYENGAFAGRIGPSARHPVSAAEFATPSVDIVGDRLAPTSDPEAERAILGTNVQSVIKTGRVYLLDSFGWSPALWRTTADLDAYLDAMVRQRDLAGALVGGLQGHADQGGYLPAPPGAHADGTAALYFPGHTTAGIDEAEMRARGRALRRFNWAMADLPVPPSYLLPPKPEIISAVHGRLVWRGAAGAAGYTIERSPNPDVPFSWETVCDDCVTDSSGFWQDKALPAGPVWYRMMPFNINGHKALPSDPFKDG